MCWLGCLLSGCKAGRVCLDCRLSARSSGKGGASRSGGSRIDGDRLGEVGGTGIEPAASEQAGAPVCGRAQSSLAELVGLVGGRAPPPRFCSSPHETWRLSLAGETWRLSSGATSARPCCIGRGTGPPASTDAARAAEDREWRLRSSSPFEARCERRCELRAAALRRARRIDRRMAAMRRMIGSATSSGPCWRGAVFQCTSVPFRRRSSNATSTIARSTMPTCSTTRTVQRLRWCTVHCTHWELARTGSCGPCVRGSDAHEHGEHGRREGVAARVARGRLRGKQPHRGAREAEAEDADDEEERVGPHE